MSQLSLLKIIIATPNIYPNEAARGLAKRNLLKKMLRRDKPIAKRSQLKMDFMQVEYPDWYID